jgi:parallel beta-helix repeat protein
LVFRESADCTLSALHVEGVRNQPAAIVIEKCRRFHLSNCTILDSDNAGILLRDVSDSRVHGNFIRDDRVEKPAFRPVVADGGTGNKIEE